MCCPFPDSPLLCNESLFQQEDCHVQKIGFLVFPFPARESKANSHSNLL